MGREMLVLQWKKKHRRKFWLPKLEMKAQKIKSKDHISHF